MTTEMSWLDRTWYRFLDLLHEEEPRYFLELRIPGWYYAVRGKLYGLLALIEMIARPGPAPSRIWITAHNASGNFMLPLDVHCISYNDEPPRMMVVIRRTDDTIIGVM